MTKRRERADVETARMRRTLPLPYRRACRLAGTGRLDEARRLYATREVAVRRPPAQGPGRQRPGGARGPRRRHRGRVRRPPGRPGRSTPVRARPAQRRPPGSRARSRPPAAGPRPPWSARVPCSRPTGPVRVAILSFLFNWPSTGGGIVHTVELARFLARAGYDVRHFYARYPGWGVGRGRGAAAPYPSEALEFDEATWNVAGDPGPVPPRRRCVRPRLRDHHRLLEHQAAPGRGRAGLPLRPAVPGAGVPLPAEQRPAAARAGGPGPPVSAAPARQPRRVRPVRRPSGATCPGGLHQAERALAASGRRTTTTGSCGRSARPRPCWSSTR